MIRVTEVLNYFKEPWYIDWVLKTFAKQFKKCVDVEKAQKFAMRDLKKICDEATDIGTEVDEIIKSAPMDHHLIHDPKRVRVEINNCLEAYNKWLEIYKPKSIVTCERFYVTIEGFEVTGQPDLYVDDEILLDVKCSKKISLSYWVQLMAYWWGKFILHDGYPPLSCFKKVGILRLDKETGSFEYVVKNFDPKLLSVWVGLMRAYCYFRGDENGGLDVQEVGEE